MKKTNSKTLLKIFKKYGFKGTLGIISSNPSFTELQPRLKGHPLNIYLSNFDRKSEEKNYQLSDRKTRVSLAYLLK